MYDISAFVAHVHYLCLQHFVKLCSSFGLKVDTLLLCPFECMFLGYILNFLPTSTSFIFIVVFVQPQRNLESIRSLGFTG